MNTVSSVSKSFSQVGSLVTLVAALSLAGCDSRTAKSLCAEQNGAIEGLSGIYEANFRNDTTFGVESMKVRIVPDEKGMAQLKTTNGRDEDETTTQICNLNGSYIMETEDKKFGGFTHARMYISQVGIHIVPVLFDKVALDADQIPNKVVVIPAVLRQAIGDLVSEKLEQLASRVFDAEDEKALYIDNANVPAAVLLQHGKPSSIGFTIFRK